MGSAELERYLEDGLSLERIGALVDKHPSTVGYWVKKHGLEAVGRDRYAAKGGIERATLERFVEQGLTIREIAERLGRGTSTISYWLRRYNLRTDGGTRRRQRREAARTGLKRLEMTCPRHGEWTFVLEGRGYYRCSKCRLEAVARRRRKVKAMLVAEAGGACVVCGYSRCQAALHFHHTDPARKEFEVSVRGVTLGIDRLRLEAAKCILLCSNCHAEVEAGVLTAPA